MNADSREQVRGAVAQLAAQAAEVRADLGAATDSLDDAFAAQLAAAAVGDDAATSAAAAQVEQLRGLRRNLTGKLGAIDSSVLEQLALLVQAALDPCDAEPDVPLVLLPVRIETRYSGDGSALRVRIYPDDIHVDRLDRGISKVERVAGTAYWRDLWTGAKSDTEAWNALLQAVHGNRAAWVAHSLTPTNLASRPDPPSGDGVQPAFPDVPPRTKPAPFARALPDRFAVVVSQGGETATAVGQPVPPTIVVGFASGDDPSMLVTQEGLPLGPGMEWLADFDRAAANGLAVTVQLPHAGAPVDSVLVCGVRSSLDPKAAADELADLLLAHRFANELAFLPQGTPTNNTETDRTTWTARPAPTQPPTRSAAASPDPSSSGAVLAAALGLDPALFADVGGAAQQEQATAAAANTALWPTTWGSFLDRLLVSFPGHGPDDDQRETLRDLFQDHVHGRGTLPALRVGDQPYGMLPVSSAGRWATTAGDRLEPGLLQVLQRLREIWRSSLTNVPALAAGGPIDDTLLDILGSAPIELGLRVRSVASDSACSVVPPLLGLDGVDTDLQAVADRIVWESLGLPPDAVTGTGALGKTTRPLGLPLVDDNDPAYIAALLADGPRSVTSVLQALLELALNAQQRAVNAAAPPERAPELVTLGSDAAGPLAPTVERTLQDTLAGGADPGEQLRLAGTIATQFGAAGPVTLALADPIAGVRGSLASLVLQPQVTKTVDVEQFALRALGAWFRANARMTHLREALAALAAISTPDRLLAVSESLDCASHRLDAWVTGLVSRRLAALRTQTPAGVMIGAYGLVENVAPGAGAQRDGGYVLAPSLAHAATAGVLRSAYLTHNADASGSGSFAVDLSSARVRAALEIVDGVRAGQPLGALLGYRFERRLHESTLALDRFVLSLRALAPLVAGKLNDHAEAPPQPAKEAISAANVVDGVQLLALRSGGTDIRTALATKPDNPYLDPGHPWTGPDDAQWAAINTALDDIADTYDAASDLLLAESVHHLVQGNTARAAAALSAHAGDATPIDPEVVRIPARGTAVTHRVLLAWREVATGSGGWSTTTPRATAEPRLAGWAEAMLGRADRIVVQVAANGTRITLDGAHLAALDVVYEAATPAALAQRIRRLVPGLQAVPLAAQRDPAWPPGFVAFGEAVSYAAALQRTLARAQAAEPASFARPGDPAQRRLLAADVAEAKTRLRTAVDAVAHLAAQLDGALSAGQPGTVAACTAGAAAYGVVVPGAAYTDVTAAQAIAAELRRRHRDANAKLTAATFGAADVTKVGQIVFGDAFWVLPVISPGDPDLYGATLDRLQPGQARVRRYLRDMAAVRASLSPYAQALLVGDALGVARTLHVAQLAPTGTSGASRWLALPFDDAQPSPDVPVASLVVDGPGDLAAGDRLVGLVLDEWSEVVPQRSERSDGAGGTVREAVVTAGIAINAAAPSARAPQAVLVAVSPDGARWSTDSLADVLRETLELAKLRAVTLERVLWIGRLLPALYEQSWSLQGEKSLDILTLVTTLARTEQMLQFVKEIQ